MLDRFSRKMMMTAFRKTRYRFLPYRPRLSGGAPYGIYIHVPFCRTECSFCPFYRELYNEELKDRYLEAIAAEIRSRGLAGGPRWVYFGGGTPNTLSVQELGSIVAALSECVRIGSMGIELEPSRLDAKYIGELAAAGFTKISLGVESLDAKLMKESGRRAGFDLAAIIAAARANGLWINCDMMVGLPHQSVPMFLDDIRTLALLKPSQITTYPYMRIRELTPESSMTEREIFGAIEKAGEIMGGHGYSRKGIWVFAIGDDVYDSSRDELIQDYHGFGPAAFSTFGGYKLVNPNLAGWLKNFETGMPMLLRAPKTKASDDWRAFARMIYDLVLGDTRLLPGYLRFYLWILKLTGYIRNDRATAKGVRFSHMISKTVVENLPYPLQNPDAVENYSEYVAYAALEAKNRLRSPASRPVFAGRNKKSLTS